jgi:hypothetical protein
MMKAILLTIGLFAVALACQPKQANTAPPAGGSEPGNSAVADSSAKGAEPKPEPTAADGPKSIRDFFMLLPEKYFVLEGCERENDTDCRKAKLDYLKTFAEIEDTANGYLKGGCDGAQSCLEMTIFKRPDGTYLFAVSAESEMTIEQHFLDFGGGKWTDVSTQVVPEFGKDKIYELPRRGTTVTVFAKKVIEKGDDYEVAEKGARLYSLVWKDGKFSKSK